MKTVHRRNACVSPIYVYNGLSGLCHFCDDNVTGFKFIAYMVSCPHFIFLHFYLFSLKVEKIMLISLECDDNSSHHCLGTSTNSEWWMNFQLFLLIPLCLFPHLNIRNVQCRNLGHMCKIRTVMWNISVFNVYLNEKRIKRIQRRVVFSYWSVVNVI